ncbi:MAG: hypothetical protein ACXV7D_15435 [Thermoanaerobaculia bacterium]
MLLRRTWFAAMALGYAAGGVFAAPPEGRPPPTAEAMFPFYTERSQNPRTWDAIAEALKRAGVSNAIVAIRVRPTVVRTAHVDLAPDNRRPARQAIVSSDLKTWKVLCITSKTEDCS